MNITQGLARAAGILGLLQGLMPVVGQLVTTAEAVFPNAKSGAQKLDWVVTFMKGVLSTAGNAVTEVEALAPLITGLVNQVVAAAKAPVTAPVIAPVEPTPPAPTP